MNTVILVGYPLCGTCTAAGPCSICPYVARDQLATISAYRPGISPTHAPYPIPAPRKRARDFYLSRQERFLGQFGKRWRR